MRARNIKPGFFKNEQLLECSMAARLLFPGLWMMADRNGYLEDRPKKIKIEIFPADNVDIPSLLQELSDNGLIIRYEVDGKRYIYIPNFAKHQTPYQNEKASEIPPYEEGLCSQKTCSNSKEDDDIQDKDDTDEPSDTGSLEEYIEEGIDGFVNGFRGVLDESKTSLRVVLAEPEKSGKQKTVNSKQETGNRKQHNCSRKTPEPIPDDATPEERAVLACIQDTPGYPFDGKDDLACLRKFSSEYPELNLLFQARRFRDYYTERGFSAKERPRARLRTWMTNAESYRLRDIRGRPNVRGDPERHERIPDPEEVKRRFAAKYGGNQEGGETIEARSGLDPVLPTG